MKTKIVTFLMVCMFLLTGLFGIFVFENQDVKAANILYVGGTGAGNHSTIQAAIDNASSGDTIYVYNGTYFENIDINVSINLIGESTTGTIIDGNDNGDVIQVNANEVAISGFTVRNCSDYYWYAGIKLNLAQNCSITNNNITSNNNYGILVSYASFNNFENNSVYSNKGSGIYLSVSHNNTFLNNTLVNNGYGPFNFSEANFGIGIDYSNNNKFSLNKIINNNLTAIRILNANNNIFTYNTIQNHNNSIECYSYGQKNIVYLNDFIGNNDSSTGGNYHCIFNSTLPLSYIYNNTNFTSYLGNYWNDYNGIDPDGNGIGNSAYRKNALTDSFPLMKPFKNYRLIPNSIKVEMNATSWKSSNISVSLLIKTAIMNATVSDGLIGVINFSNLELLIINSSSFAGSGFFKSDWSGIIEGRTYHGTWHGMLFNKSGERKFYLKGTVFGGLQGITDGFFIESSSGSGIYDLYNSTWTISHLGSHLIFANLTVNGSINYQTSKNNSSEVYILQACFKGKAEGYYNGSLAVVLTHIRINNSTSLYYGQGFSFISYVCNYGSGSGWTYDKTVSTNIVKLTGWFTEPLWGIVFGVLDETGPIKKLTITIIRIDTGLAPTPIIIVHVWGPWGASPGQTVNYILQYRNIGLKSAINTEIVMTLPDKVWYKSNTGAGSYNSTSHEVTWRRNISSKSYNQVSVKCQVKWGLTWGTKLKCIGYVRDYVTNTTLALDTFITIIRVARDPNVKHGPEGNVTPGQKLNYTIEFENEGSGIAFGVYFTDTLSDHLNDSSLKIGPVISAQNVSTLAPAGEYDLDTRTITWFVGEVGPKDGGYANISINVRNDAKIGTEILNYGIVYFPSVPEVTKTNGIVSIVNINKVPTANAGSNLVLNTLQNIIFNGSNSFDPDGIIINYTWNFDDGEFGYGMVTSHTYTDDGNYYVNLTVMDDWGYIDSHEILVQVLNRLPVAKLEVDLLETLTNTQVTLDATKSSDVDGSVVDYYFNFGDGSNSGWIKTPSVTHTYTDGTKVYSARLTVKDDDGGISTNIALVEISVNNRAPEAALSVDPIEAYTFEDIICNADLSTDPDGQISSYYFDFGDGTNSGWVNTASIPHQFNDGPNEYTVTLKVKDDDGTLSPTITSETITILNRKPVASFKSDKTDVYTFDEVVFDAFNSYDLDGEVLEYKFDFGDGTNTGWITNPVAKHKYTDGTKSYTISVKVKDDDGETDSSNILITVQNRAPLAAAGMDQLVETNQDVHFNGELSSDSDGNIISYNWSFGDGSTELGKAVSHVYMDNGEYTVTLTATDDDGAVGVDTCMITVNNVKPIAGFTVQPITGDVTTEFKFESTSFDTDGSITGYRWDFADGEASDQTNPTHQYKSSGTYFVSLIVMDDDGSESTAFKQNVTLFNLSPSVIAKSSTNSAKVGDDIIFDASQSYDLDGEIINFTWQFGDGSFAYNPYFVYAYNDRGTYTITLFIIDDSNNKAETTLVIVITEELIDFDGDGYSDDIDAFPNDAAAAVDTDGDKYPDYWNLGKSEKDSTTGLTLDEYPNDPNRHKKEASYEGINIQAFAILIVIIILVIIALALFVLRKKKHTQIGEPYTDDETLAEVRTEVLMDSNGQSLRISHDKIKRKLDKSFKKGELSKETYKYINREILYTEIGQHDQSDSETEE